MRLALLCALVAMTASPALAQYPDAVDSVAVVAEPAPDEEANVAPDPNAVPYETETNVGEQVLAFPSMMWNGVAYLFREAVLFAEYRGIIDRLQRQVTGPEPPKYGFTPVFNVGGREGLVLGGSVYYNDLFGTGRRVRVGGRYGFGGTYGITGAFRDPGLFGSGVRFDLDGGYFNDEEERFFFGGNEASQDDQFDYAFRMGRAEATTTVPLPAHLDVAFEAEYKYIDVRDGDTPFPRDLVTGFGEAHHLSGGGYLVLDLAKRDGFHAQREYAGSIFLAGYRYGQDLGDRDFAFHRAEAEVRHFVSVPFLPYDRRLAFRLRYEKTFPPQGDLVPFYEDATLGGTSTLRGYAPDRFRDEGYLLLNTEYRWPVWDILDGVVFVDTGQVFRRHNEIALDAFHANIGAGLRVYGRSGVAGRLEAAYSPEGLRLIAQVGTVF